MFPNPVVVTQATVTSGNGNITNVSGNGSKLITVDLANVTNAQSITVALFGNGTGQVSITMKVLIGDTTGNGTVNASDVAQTKAQSGMSVNTSNMRADVTANGTINASDVSLVKSKSGTSLP